MMMKHRVPGLVLLVALLAGAVCGCRQREIYHVKGLIEEVKVERQHVRIQHEEIPNYMAAMSMIFDVRDTNELTGLTPGDYVSFRLIVLKDDAWIDRVRKLSNAPPAALKTRPLYREVRAVEPLKVGDLVPDYRFTNQLGQPVLFSRFKGQVLGVTFIFTRCPLPTFCPRMSGNFADVSKALQALPNAPTNWHLLSISIDPEFDTPRVMTAYAKQFKAEPARWSFLSGTLVDTTALGEQVGLEFWRPEPSEEANISHNVRTLVIDPQGRLHKVIEGNEWKPGELVEEMVKALTVKPQ
jgi:protein SCO1/2